MKNEERREWKRMKEENEEKMKKKNEGNSNTLINYYSWETMIDSSKHCASHNPTDSAPR